MYFECFGSYFLLLLFLRVLLKIRTTEEQLRLGQNLLVLIEKKACTVVCQCDDVFFPHVAKENDQCDKFCSNQCGKDK